MTRKTLHTLTGLLLVIGFVTGLRAQVGIGGNLYSPAGDSSAQTTNSAIKIIGKKDKEKSGDASGSDKAGDLPEKVNFTFDKRRGKILNPVDWYFKASTVVSYFNLGTEFNGLIGQIEGMFSGNEINPDLLVFPTSFSMTTSQKVTRAKTHFIPTGNLGLGYTVGRHQFEMDFGLAGLVPLNTVNVTSDMTLRENKTCSQAELDACPLAKLGFVSQKTGKGSYDFSMVLNEEIWILTPSFYYDYIITTTPFGRFSAGGSMGLVMMSAAQKIRFKATRKDGGAKTGNISDDYSDRVLEGSAESVAMNDIGPIFRVYAGFKRNLTKSLKTEIRLGFNYGFVNLNRDVDGSAVAKMGKSLAASFPTSALGFKNQETNKFEMLGMFFQAGLVF